jgi:antitoxin (DNA-binding transcriptional repressor) of toxin-antitoxin stability system/predicted nucleic acid-binding protein
MRRAGVREARQNLSVLLGYVGDGHEILITDRGRPVARLVAPLPESVKAFAGRAAFRKAMPTLSPPLSHTVGDARDAGSPRPAWPRRLPGPLYLDGSALAKLYLPEPDSAAMEGALRGRRDLIVSELSVTELVAGYAARATGRGPAREKAGRLQSALLEDLESGAFRRVDLSPATHRAAERLALSLADSSPVPPLCALHLALGMTAGVATFVTMNPLLAGAAQRVGLTVSPGGAA